MTDPKPEDVEITLEIQDIEIGVESTPVIPPS